MADKPRRTTADLSAYPELVVIYLGMRIEEPRGLETIARLGIALGGETDPVAHHLDEALPHALVVGDVAQAGGREPVGLLELAVPAQVQQGLGDEFAQVFFHGVGEFPGIAGNCNVPGGRTGSAPA